jgi:hypothetical protein
MPKQQIQIGDKVRLTRAYLKSTGQMTGPEPMARFIVRGIDRHWAVTDAPACTDYFSAEELAADPSLAFRRIALANLEVCR